MVYLEGSAVFIISIMVNTTVLAIAFGTTGGLAIVALASALGTTIWHIV